MRKVECYKCHQIKPINECQPANSRFVESAIPEEIGKRAKWEFNYTCDSCSHVEARNE